MEKTVKKSIRSSLALKLCAIFLALVFGVVVLLNIYPVAMARDLAAKHKVMPTRPQTVAYRLLNRHAEYVERLAEIFLEKCQGHDKFALEMMQKFIADYGKYDYELERYFDFGLAMSALRVIVKQMPTIEF